MSYSGFDPLTDGVLTRRVFAWFIDVFILGVVVWLAGIVILALGVVTLGLGFGLLAGLPALGFFYHALFVAGAHCATPGQRLLDLSVRREEDLGPPGLFRAVVFTIGLWITLGSACLLLLVAPFTPRKRALHDIVAGVIVVRNRALTLGPHSMNMGFGSPAR